MVFTILSLLEYSKLTAYRWHVAIERPTARGVTSGEKTQRTNTKVMKSSIPTPCPGVMSELNVVTPGTVPSGLKA